MLDNYWNIVIMANMLHNGGTAVFMDCHLDIKLMIGNVCDQNHFGIIYVFTNAYS